MLLKTRAIRPLRPGETATLAIFAVDWLPLPVTSRHLADILILWIFGSIFSVRYSDCKRNGASGPIDLIQMIAALRLRKA
jgi:hypothetical protein